jgi:hypothetical protein
VRGSNVAESGGCQTVTTIGKPDESRTVTRARVVRHAAAMALADGMRTESKSDDKHIAGTPVVKTDGCQKGSRCAARRTAAL